MKKNKILELFQNVEQEKEQLFEKLNTVDTKKLNHKPNQDKWSIIQIIYHLYKSEQLSIIYIKRSVSKPDRVSRSGLLSKIRGLILVLALKTNYKFKAPQNVAKVPEFGDLETYSTKWSKVRIELQKIIEQAPEKILKSDIFNHPTIGKMNIYYAVKFIQTHFQHHKKQIESIL